MVLELRFWVFGFGIQSYGFMIVELVELFLFFSVRVWIETFGLPKVKVLDSKFDFCFPV